MILFGLLCLNLHSFPQENIRFLVRQGYSLIEQKEYKKAVKSFEKALKIDRNCREAHLGKGIVYYKWGEYNSREIYPEEYIKKALKIDPDYLEAKIHLGWCYYSKGSRNKAVKYMDDLLEKEDPDPNLFYGIARFFDFIENYYYLRYKTKIPALLRDAHFLGLKNPELNFMLGWQNFLQDSIGYAVRLYNEGLKLEEKENFLPYMELGIIYYNKGDAAKSREYFSAAKKIMPESIRLIFKDIPDNNIRDHVLRGLAVKYFTLDNKLTDEGKKYIESNVIFYEKNPMKENAFITILSDAQKMEYFEKTTLEEKKNYIKNFYLMMDTSPFNKEDEILKEFDRRYKYILKAYKGQTPEGFDDRGKIYLKYGEPENRHIGVYGPLHTESWMYQRLNNSMAFDFASALGPFRKVANMYELATLRKHYDFAVRRKSVFDITRELFTERWYMGGYYGMMAARVELKSYSDLDIIADCIEFEVYRNELSEKIIVNDFPSKNKESHLNFGHRTADFKDSRANVRNEIYFGVNLENLKFEQKENKYVSSIRFYTAIIDSGANRLINDTADFYFSSESEAKKGIAVNQLKYLVPPGKYTLFVQMRNPEGKKTGVYSQLVNIGDYKTQNLKLSGIQFSFNIREAKPNDKYIKNNLNITPYPFFEISKSCPIQIYYEIYNLEKNENGKTSYKITYEIKLLEGKESIWKKLFKGKNYRESISIGKNETGNLQNTFDHTSFDLTKLRTGKYEITVRVKDRNSGKSVQKSDTFILVK